jgi:hypothetical protein
MVVSRSGRRWFRLPSRIALILGMGALSTTGAQADVPERANPGAFDDVSVRSEGGRIFLSEGGRETELRLSPTPQRDRLLRLLDEHGPAGVKLDGDPRLIMSSGGGAGFYWWGARKSGSEKPSPELQNPSQVPRPPASGLNPGANPGSVPRDLYPTTNKKG